MERPATKTDLEMQARMQEVEGDEERVDALAKARMFKRSWIELAEVLSTIYDRESWEGWGYESFDAYCKGELHLTPGTALKLLGSFRFLKTSAPRVLTRALGDASAPLPSMRAIDFVARAEERGAADDDQLREIRRAAFDEGVDAPALSRKFRAVAFPVSDDEQKDRARERLTGAARRLAALIAEPEVPVPRKIAVAVEEALGQLIEALEAA